MERIKQPIVFLDTHIVCWLYEGLIKKLSHKAKHFIEDATELYVSPIILVELEYLYEIDRIQWNSDKILSALWNDIGLSINEASFLEVARCANSISWTRDLFDRLIVAQTQCIKNAYLITKDQQILAHFERAIW